MLGHVSITDPAKAIEPAIQVPWEMPPRMRGSGVGNDDLPTIETLSSATLAIANTPIRYNVRLSCATT